MSSSERAIVTVRLEGVTTAWDVETPVDLPITDLGRAIAETLGWPAQPYVVFADPPGRMLAADETLAKAGVCDGAWLTLRPGLGPDDAHGPATQPAAPGYVWKRIDGDA